MIKPSSSVFKAFLRKMITKLHFQAQRVPLYTSRAKVSLKTIIVCISLISLMESLLLKMSERCLLLLSTEPRPVTLNPLSPLRLVQFLLCSAFYPPFDLFFISPKSAILRLFPLLTSTSSFSPVSMPPPGHRFPWTWGLAAAASGWRVPAICHAGSWGPWHRAGPVAVVGRAHLL